MKKGMFLALAGMLLCMAMKAQQPMPPDLAGFPLPKPILKEKQEWKIYADTGITKADLLAKSQSQKTTGYILLCGGVVLCTFGTLIFSNNYDVSGIDNGTTASAVMMGVGALSAIGSLPFFIGSAHKAKRAAMMGFKNQELLIPHPGNPLAKYQPAISLRINF
jgi:hypothetical protein